MRGVNTTAQAKRSADVPFTHEVPMLWIGSYDRDSGQTTTGVGFWKGPDVEDIAAIDFVTGINTTRRYYNKGLGPIGPVEAFIGLDVRPISVRLSSYNPATLLSFYELESRGAIAQAWKRIYDTNTGKPIAVEPWFYGRVNRAPTEKGAVGDASVLNLEIVTSARSLSITSGFVKSDAQQRKRENDRFRRHKGNNKEWIVPWGLRGKNEIDNGWRK